MPLALSYQQIETAVRALPAAPRILAQLAAKLQSADVDIAEVTSILRRDSALTGLLIDTANSAAYFGYEASTTIEDAVARVGYSETYRIIGEAASRQVGDEPLPWYGVSSQRLRENSLFCALVMEQIAAGSGIDRGTGYTIGLLRSIGKVVLDRIARQQSAVPRFDATDQHLLDWERLHFGITNPEVAARTLDLWDFPRDAIDATRDHQAPGPESSREAFLLHVAATMAEQRDYGMPGERSYWRPLGEACRRASVDDARVIAAADHAHEVVQRVSPAFA